MEQVDWIEWCLLSELAPFFRGEKLIKDVINREYLFGREVSKLLRSEVS